MNKDKTKADELSEMLDNWDVFKFKHLLDDDNTEYDEDDIINSRFDNPKIDEENRLFLMALNSGLDIDENEFEEMLTTIKKGKGKE